MRKSPKKSDPQGLIYRRLGPPFVAIGWETPLSHQPLSIALFSGFWLRYRLQYFGTCTSWHRLYAFTQQPGILYCLSHSHFWTLNPCFHPRGFSSVSLSSWLRYRPVHPLLSFPWYQFYAVSFILRCQHQANYLLHVGVDNVPLLPSFLGICTCCLFPYVGVDNTFTKSLFQYLLLRYLPYPSY